MTTIIDTRLEFDQADRLRRALRVSGYSVQDAADALEVSRNTISSWINGRTVPRRRDLRAYAELTDFPFDWLADDSGSGSLSRTAPALRARRDSNPQPSDLYPHSLPARSARLALVLLAVVREAVRS